MNYSIIYGINSVLASLKSNETIDKIFISSDSKKARFQPILQIAQKRNILIQYIPTSALNKKAGVEKHQGVLAILTSVKTIDLEELLEKCKKSGDPPLLTILDGIEDPHNFGAIIRSAEAAGFNGMIIQDRHSAPLSPVVHKSSAGALSYFPIARVNNLAKSLERLKEAGFWIFGSDEKSSESFWKLETDIPLAMIIGNEGKGIRRLLKEKCDFLVQIPMFGKTESLNASVAAALLFYEIRRKRTK